MMGYGWTLDQTLDLTFPQIRYFLDRMREWPPVNLVVAALAQSTKKGADSGKGLSKLAAMSGGFKDLGPLAEILRSAK